MGVGLKKVVVERTVGDGRALSVRLEASDFSGQPDKVDIALLRPSRGEEADFDVLGRVTVRRVEAQELIDMLGEALRPRY